MDIAGSKANDVFQFLDFHEKKVTPSYLHHDLGWVYFENELFFRLQNAIKKEDSFSDYEGYFLIEPKGKYEEWLDIIKAEVIGHPPLEMILGSSFAAPIASMLNISHRGDIDSLLINIVGNSTSGKTTAATVAVSPFGSPSINNNGLIQSFNGTPNALQALISGNFGVPMVFDEVSMNTMSENTLTSFIYKLAQNKEKARLNKESELRETLFWCTVIFFTGELSMLANAKNNVGLRVRLFEFKNIQWTKDGPHAERIKTGLMNNYGYAGAKYVQHLLQVGLDAVEEKWNEYKDYIENKLPDSKYSVRIAGKFATILTGAHYANEALKLNISIENISDILIEQELESMDERELAPKFYSELKQKLIQYRKYFKFNNTNPDRHQEIWGKLEITNDRTHCYILPSKFKELAKDLGFADGDILLKELQTMGVLRHENDKRQIRKAIFTKDEGDIRDKVLKGKKYSSKGDYTVCIVYDGDILEGFYEDESNRLAYPNRTPRSRTVKANNSKTTAEALFAESKKEPSVEQQGKE